MILIPKLYIYVYYYNSTTSPAKLHKGQGVEPLPLHAGHLVPFSLLLLLSLPLPTTAMISFFCNHPALHLSLSFKFLVLIHNLVSGSHVLVSSTKLSFPSFRLCVHSKCLHPNTLSIAVHFDPTILLAGGIGLLRWKPPLALSFPDP